MVRTSILPDALRALEPRWVRGSDLSPPRDRADNPSQLILHEYSAARHALRSCRDVFIAHAVTPTASSALFQDAILLRIARLRGAARPEREYGWRAYELRALEQCPREEKETATNAPGAPLSESRAAGPYSEYTSMRVKVVQVGGHPPEVTVLSVTDGQFTLRIATEEQAKRLAQGLYKDLTVSAKIFRDANGKIIDGNLLEFTIVEDLSPERQLEVWREWFAEAGAGWNDVDDIEEELRRLRSE